MSTLDYAMRVASQLHNENKITQTKIILNSILDIMPGHAYALHLSGIIAWQSGEALSAIQLIQQAIASHANDALFYSNLGEMYRQLKQIDTSIQYGQQAVALAPDSATALSNLGIAYYDAKQYDQAEAYHQRALAIQPTLACSLNNMGSLYKSQEQTQKAIAYYQAAIKAAPSFIEPLTNLGTLFFEQHELQQSLLHFEKALQLNINSAEAYCGMAKIHLHKHNYREAENHIRKAITIKPSQAKFHQLLAEIYHEQGNNVEALAHLTHAISIDPTNVSSYLAKGNILMEIGETDQAEEQFLKISKDKDVDTRVQAHYCLVQLRKINPNYPSLKALTDIVNNIQEVSAHKQEYAYFALGKCHDDLGDGKKSFYWFTQGCNAKRKRIHYNTEEQSQLTNNIINTFSKTKIEHLRTKAHPSELPIFIVGMPRSGTTLVEQIIASHNSVHGAGELTYLNDLSEQDHIAEKYLERLRQISPKAARITDKMPQNFNHIGLIHALFPNAKIIHVQRNPIDTCLSAYTKLFTKGHHYSYDLKELAHYYNCYQTIMNYWRQILPANTWMDVNYEDLIQNTENEAKRLIAYCNLEWDPACFAFYKSKRTVRTASFMQVRQPIYTSSQNRWQKLEDELAPLIQTLNSVAQQHT